MKLPSKTFGSGRIEISNPSAAAAGGAAAICGSGKRVFLTDSRYEEVAGASLEGWQLEIVRGDWLAGLAPLAGSTA